MSCVYAACEGTFPCAELCEQKGEIDWTSILPHDLKKKVVCALVQVGRYAEAVAPLATSRLSVQIPAVGSGLPRRGGMP